jgi:uncharacterized protein (TIGR02145 family)
MLGPGDDDNGITDPETAASFDFNSMKDKDILPIYYSENGGQDFAAAYEAVKIGEYLWMNSNFNHFMEPGHEPTQAQINRGLYQSAHIDTLQYHLTPDDVNKYIGDYYDMSEIAYMNSVGNMYEGDEKAMRGKWGLPSQADFRQLFAMCGDASDVAVRSALCYHPDEIPLVKKMTNIFWVQDYNTNKYGFNLIYGGERAHNNNVPWGTCFNANECYNYNADQGNFMIFFTTAVFPTSDEHTVIMHDYPDASRGKEWLWKPMRWCRRLTDAELGYKLYINSNNTDIQKLGIKESAPQGYRELEKGYLRGFYVQYILNNPNPDKTVTDLVKMLDTITELK